MSEPTEQAPEAPTPTQSSPGKPCEAEKITKPKSPGRIAAGKRLAEMNRKNKAKKQGPQTEEPGENWDINPGYVIGALGLAVAAGSLYLQWKSNKSEHRALPVPPVVEPPHAPKPKSRIPEME